MTIILATGNQHKIREFHAMLEGKNAKIYTYSEILEPLEILENG
ncbi:non-canonical purine NTP pyrophosphatase, partial [uncultured Helicobacter sp.]